MSESTKNNIQYVNFNMKILNDNLDKMDELTRDLYEALADGHNSEAEKICNQISYYTSEYKRQVNSIKSDMKSV